MEWGTTWFACSKAAAKWIFPEKLIERKSVKVVYNGIDINRFKYDEKKRVTMRKSLGLNNEFVLIHTGRFIDQKNQGFQEMGEYPKTINVLGKECVSYK